MSNKYGISDHYFYNFEDLNSRVLSNFNFVRNFDKNEVIFLVTKDYNVFGLIKFPKYPIEVSSALIRIKDLFGKQIIDIDKIMPRYYIAL